MELTFHKVIAPRSWLILWIGNLNKFMLGYIKRTFCILSFCFLLISCGYTQKFGSAGKVDIQSFGAKGDGITNDTRAFQRASDYLQRYGGTLIIDSGTYILGKQTLSGRYGAGVSWKAEPIMDFINTVKPITIIGNRATLKAADGLRYGSFDPVTGKEDNKRTVGHPSNYYTSTYIFINAEGCTSIEIKGLTIDGNLGNMIISEDIYKGIQLPALGIRLVNNKKVKIEDCYIHHCGLDGLYIAWNGLTDKDPPYPHKVINVICRYNGRQGLSWAGGNSLTVINSEFSHTGRALHDGKPLVSLPAAGIDIEVQNSIIRNGTFINCLVSDNAGYGLSSIGHPTDNINFKNVTFIGTTNYAAFPKSRDFSFDSCIFIGAMVGLYGSKNTSEATYFKDCLFSMDSSLSPTGHVFGTNAAFYNAQNVIFDNCTFVAGNKRLPKFNHKEILFIDCTFIQNSDKQFRAIATFKGTTRFLIKGGGKINAAEATFKGPVIYNGDRVSDAMELNKLQYK